MVEQSIIPFKELRGLALPAKKTGTGGYFGSKSKNDVAWGDLLLALFVPRGSRVMRREVGSVLRSELFEPLDNEFLDGESLEFHITDVLAAHAPHIIVHEVEVGRKFELQGKGVFIRILFSINTDNATKIDRTITIRKTEVSLSGEA